ncbi:helix-turn-helix domain-containing protein [Absiella sp. AM54-8XD]|uniref:helix-turn-helix domain-containing protein n=1 Tax=Absiella sp. AM54-8XD TaxID=2292279 RepID=UPI001F3EA7B0|nr:helix-turn-helix domain-containing protein [Absiella sp. AM54-8XD]
MYFYRKICSSDLPANAVNVYKVLLQYANRTTWCCFPSVRTIAHDSKLSERTVRRQLNVLVSHGYIYEYQGREKIMVLLAICIF